MIEFIPFGLLFAIPIGWASFVLARRKGRSARRWGLWMWVLAAIWLTGAAALPSLPGSVQEKLASMAVLFLGAGCFALQVVMAAWLVTARGTDGGAAQASGTRVVILLAVLGAVLALSLIFAFVM